MSSTQSQNVIMHSFWQPKILNPSQSVQATNLNDSDPTAAQYLNRFYPDQTECVCVCFVKSVVCLLKAKFIICLSLLCCDKLIIVINSFFQIFF